MRRETSMWRRVGQYLGLVYADEGHPSSTAPRRSRYERGHLVSPRLDEDIDDLRARLAALEQRRR